MSERETELGYPPPTRNQDGRPISFSLPSLSQITLPQPNNHSLPAKLDGLRLSKAKSISPKSTTLEIIDESLLITKADKEPIPSSPDIPVPTSSEKLAVAESISSPPPPAFKTWVPDGSLRFINPDFLSSAEKQTLEQQTQVEVKAGIIAGKRKACEETPISNGDKGEHLSNKEKVDVNIHEERPKKMGRPLPTKDEDLLGPPPLATISSPRGRPSATSTQRRHSRPSSNQSNETDLLRQVKSNNLSMPTLARSSINVTHGPIPNFDRYMNWIPSGNYPQDRVQYNHIHNQRQQQHQHQPQQRLHTPQQNKQNDLFTYKPLYHPPAPTSYTYRPEPTQKPSASSSTSSTDIHPRDQHFSPTASACASDSPPLTELPSGGATPVAMNQPHGDWRRKYVGRGRGQSGG